MSLPKNLTGVRFFGQLECVPSRRACPSCPFPKGVSPLWDENVYGGSADIKFQLIDKCPAGGGFVSVRTAERYPLKARIRVRESEIGNKFAGRCLWVRATVEHADGTIPLYTADYFYTNGREHHAMD